MIKETLLNRQKYQKDLTKALKRIALDLQYSEWSRNIFEIIIDGRFYRLKRRDYYQSKKNVKSIVASLLRDKISFDCQCSLENYQKVCRFNALPILNCLSKTFYAIRNELAACLDSQYRDETESVLSAIANEIFQSTTFPGVWKHPVVFMIDGRCYHAGFLKDFVGFNKDQIEQILKTKIYCNQTYESFGYQYFWNQDKLPPFFDRDGEFPVYFHIYSTPTFVEMMKHVNGVGGHIIEELQRDDWNDILNVQKSFYHRFL